MTVMEIMFINMTGAAARWKLPRTCCTSLQTALASDGTPESILNAALARLASFELAVSQPDSFHLL